jgi:hypothetical protein
MTFKVKNLFPGQESFLDLEELRVKSYKDGYDLLVLRYPGRPLVVLTPEGAHQTIEMATEEELDTFIAKRRSARPVRMTHMTGGPSFRMTDRTFRMADALTGFTRRAGVFTGTSGNLSVRATTGGDLFVSPSGVAKATLIAKDLVPVAQFRDGLGHHGPRMPSVDTPMQAAVYRRYPHIVAQLHLHIDTAGAEDPIPTTFPHACGTEEEVKEIIDALERFGLMASEGFCVELVHHGFLIGFTFRQLNALAARLAAFDPPSVAGAKDFRRKVIFGHGRVLHMLTW